jgi:hypothetical protein
LASALPVRAADGDSGYILSDQDLTDTSVPDGFSQRFLTSHAGALANMTFADIDGSMKKPGDLIDFYGKIYGVNPRFLLALIQKEQSLVDDPNPSQCQIDWAAGYGRPDGSTCDDPNWQRYRGFTTQIVSAAAFVRFIYDGDHAGTLRTFGFFAGVPTTIDGQDLTPANIATAILYTYTPHLHGNLNLRTIWANWFTQGYPDGSVLSDSQGDSYLIQGGLRRRFDNKSALHTRVDPDKIIPVADTVIAGYPEGSPIKFSDYSLVRVPAGTIYLLVGDRKRPIQSMDVFRAIGFNPEEIDDVDPADLEAYADGDPITLKGAYPTGALLQDSKTGGIYYVENGTKSPIVDISILKADYWDKKVSKATPAALAKYDTAAPLKFKEGDLVTGTGTDRAVYVISNGQRRAIVSGAVFEQLGYSWKRVISTTQAVLDMHPLGPVVSGVAPIVQPVPATLASN